MGFTTASIVAEQRAELIKVTTGCKELDNILEGKHYHGQWADLRAAWHHSNCCIHTALIRYRNLAAVLLHSTLNIC
jgi:uncharacterized protein YjlB